MKKRLQGALVGILIGVLLANSVVFAESFSKNAELFYNGIKIFIDGGEIVPKDALGKTVEPFIMNGTTYLPVRAVANAFDQDVEWDGETQSVYIGKKDQTKPDNYLHKIQYNDYQESIRFHNLAIINGTVTDYNGNVYTNGLLLFNYHSTTGFQNDPDKAHLLIGYPLNSVYSTLKGNIVLPKECNLVPDGSFNGYTGNVDVFFYGDGKLLYKATEVTPSMPFTIDINIKGVNQLVIKTRTTEHESAYIALTDLALYK